MISGVHKSLQKRIKDLTTDSTFNGKQVAPPSAEARMKSAAASPALGGNSSH